MTRVFHLASDLGPTAAGKQLSLLVPGLAAAGFTPAVGVLGEPTPFAGAVAAAGVPVLRLPIRHALDANGAAAAARAVVGFGPDVVHAWGPAAVRVCAALRLAGRVTGVRPGVVVTGRGGRPPGDVGRLAWRAVAPAAWTDLPLAVAPAPPPADAAEFRRAVGVPDSARLVVAAGRFDAASGLKHAVWAFDVLKYAARDVYLVLVGDGPERGRTARFSRAIGFDDDRVRFAGTRPDLPAVFGLAEVAWVTHQRGGANVALEAMAAGVPVVGFDTPAVASVVDDGATGRLVPPGDRVRLAAVTGDLLDDPAARARLGAAARAAAARFPPGVVVDRFARIYHDVIPGGRT